MLTYRDVPKCQLRHSLSDLGYSPLQSVGGESGTEDENRGLWNKLLGYSGAVFASASRFGPMSSAMMIGTRNR